MVIDLIVHQRQTTRQIAWHASESPDYIYSNAFESEVIENDE